MPPKSSKLHNPGTSPHNLFINIKYVSYIETFHFKVWVYHVFGFRFKMIRDHGTATQMLELAQVLMDWCPDFKKRNEEKLRIGMTST